MEFSTESLSAIADGDLTIVRCRACGELYLSAIADRWQDVDDENDWWLYTTYEASCAHCGADQGVVISFDDEVDLIDYHMDDERDSLRVNA